MISILATIALNRVKRFFSPGKRTQLLYPGLIVYCAVLFHTASCTAGPRIKNEQLEGDWLIELRHDDIGLVRTVMHFVTDSNTLEAYTRQNADKDILGGWTAMMGRTFTSGFKNGSLLHIEQGSFAAGKDTIKLVGILTSAMGSYGVKGYVHGHELFATLSNGSGGYKGTLSGRRERATKPMEDYPLLFEKALTLTEDNIYNKELLKTSAWSTFVKDMRAVCPRLQDDLEMVFAFFYFVGKLPISHYALLKPLPEKAETLQNYKQRYLFEEKKPGIAYLKINTFEGSASEIDSLTSLIGQKSYPYLIVDLRNNPGGSIEAGMRFTTWLADTTFYGGIFLTQKYFNKHNSPPGIDDYALFPHFSEANFNLILEGIHNTEGLCLKIVPAAHTYKGKVFILTNSRTASTCEPLVYGLQQQKRATVIGEKTAGAMLNGELFKLEKGFSMFIPTADYYTADGFRIDQQGVQPDIETNKEDALAYTLQHLVK